MPLVPLFIRYVGKPMGSPHQQTGFWFSPLPSSSPLPSVSRLMLPARDGFQRLTEFADCFRGLLSNLPTPTTLTIGNIHFVMGPGPNCFDTCDIHRGRRFSESAHVAFLRSLCQDLSLQLRCNFSYLHGVFFVQHLRQQFHILDKIIVIFDDDQITASDIQV